MKNNLFALLLVGLYLMPSLAVAICRSGDSFEQIKYDAHYGCSGAQYSMGSYYYSGSEEVKQDYAEALKWFKKAKGFANADYKVGQMYLDGLGTAQDYEKSAHWLKKVANIKGNCYFEGCRTQRDAQYLLATLYFKGSGVTQDYNEAFRLFKEAASRNHGMAQFAVGDMYYTGLGITKDVVAAHMWMSIAVSNNTTKAEKVRATIAKQMTPSQIKKSQYLVEAWVPLKGW
jgi:TPR repeat protein